jgi:hypothetical protein
LIVKALNAKQPATRYHGGGSAGLLLSMRRRMSDRMFDEVVMSMFR